MQRRSLLRLCLRSVIRVSVPCRCWMRPPLTGCVDTRYYWNVTKNIFRYHHLHEKERYNGAHTVNEGRYRSSTRLRFCILIRLMSTAVRAEGWIETIRFHIKFVLNVDENL